MRTINTIFNDMCVSITSGWRPHQKAMTEGFFTLFFSFLPILVLIAIDIFSSRDGNFNIKLSFFKTIKNGELFFYLTSMTSPIFYLVLKDRESNRRFPNTILHMFVFILLYLVSAIFFVLQRAKPSLNQEVVLGASVWLFCFAAIWYYLILVCNNSMSDIPKIMEEEDKRFAQEVDSHRGEN